MGKTALPISMAGMSLSSLLLGLVFSSVGFVAFMYGKRTMRVRAMGIGGALMAYPYFVRGVWPTILVGCALSAMLWFWRD